MPALLDEVALRGAWHSGYFVELPCSPGVSPPSLTRAAPSLSSPLCTDLAMGLDAADVGQSGEPDQRSAMCRK